MCCFISTKPLFMATRCFKSLETVCTSFALHGPHTVYFSHIWLGVWILNCGFPEDVLGF